MTKDMRRPYDAVFSLHFVADFAATFVASDTAKSANKKEMTKDLHQTHAVQVAAAVEACAAAGRTEIEATAAEIVVVMTAAALLLASVWTATR
jgi:hypothetical protein